MEKDSRELFCYEAYGIGGKKMKIRRFLG